MFSRAGLQRQLATWRATFQADDQLAMQLIVAAACLALTVSIGYTYARHISVVGWQLWAWLIAVCAAAAALIMACGQPPLTWDRAWRWPLLLAGIAVLLRLLFVETVPGGLHVDEVAVADFSLRHVFNHAGETINPFRSGPASQPSLYHYLVRLSLAVAGNSITGLRLTSALAGGLAVLATYALVAVYQNRTAALLAASLMTTYHYHIHWSRIGLNNIWDTLWVPLMLAAFGWGWRKGWAGGAVIAGLAAGLAQYFYAGSKLGLLLLVFVAAQFWWAERQARRKGQPGVGASKLPGYLGRTALMAGIVAAPILFFALRDPAVYFDRSRMVFAWQPAYIERVTGVADNYLVYAWNQLVQSAGAYTTIADLTGFYGPEVPLLIGLAAPLFIIGFIWALYKRMYLPALWVAMTALLGGFLLVDPPSSSHYVVAIPAICWLTIVPLEWLIGRGYWRLAVVILAAVMLTDLVFYFGLYVPAGPRDLIHPFPPWPPAS